MSRPHIWFAIVCFSVCPFVGQPAGAQTVDPAFAADIQKLMEVTGSSAMGTQVASFVAAHSRETEEVATRYA
jgi:hypothetical protein